MQKKYIKILEGNISFIKSINEEQGNKLEKKYKKVTF